MSYKTVIIIVLCCFAALLLLSVELQRALFGSAGRISVSREGAEAAIFDEGIASRSFREEKHGRWPLAGDRKLTEDPNKALQSISKEIDKPPTPPLGLSPVPWPDDNPYSAKKAELGRLLYFDTRLSADGTVACATCHSPDKAFTDRRSVSQGIDGRLGSRNAPTVINSAYATSMFWDGRAKTLEEQCGGPLANPNEMADVNNANLAHFECQERIKEIPGYRELFKEVFGNDNCTIKQIEKAVATFERTVLSGNAPYDRFLAGDKSALTQTEQAGYQVYLKAGCAFCHTGPTLSDGKFTNIGVGMDKEKPDLGRYTITKQEKDYGAFKVPTLRDVALTYPYMHDGSFDTLEQVVDFYDKGGIPNKNLHFMVKPLHLSAQEKKALVAFLKSLNGEGWQSIRPPEQFPQ